METTFAIIEQGHVTNLIHWDGNTANWQPPEGAAAVPVPPGTFVNIGSAYADDQFEPPPERPAPTVGEVLAMRDAYLREATLRIAPLQDADDLGEATESEIASLLAWKRYRIDVSRISQQPDFPAEVVWPEQPQ